jgi:hypothetical protein
MPPDFLHIRRATNGFVVNIGSRIDPEQTIVAVDAGELAQQIENWATPPAPAKPKPARAPRKR